MPWNCTSGVIRLWMCQFCPAIETQQIEMPYLHCVRAVNNQWRNVQKEHQCVKHSHKAFLSLQEMTQLGHLIHCDSVPHVPSSYFSSFISSLSFVHNNTQSVVIFGKYAYLVCIHTHTFHWQKFAAGKWPEVIHFHRELIIYIYILLMIWCIR